MNAHLPVQVLRCVMLLLVASGCSMNVYSSGKHKGILQPGTPRAAVLTELGPPAFSSVDRRMGEAARRDTYHTKETLPEYLKASGAGMTAGMTGGISEIWAVPTALIDHHSHHPKTLTVVYDEQDKLKNYGAVDSRDVPR